MIVLAGADVVRPDGVASDATLIIDGDRIATIQPSTAPAAGTIDFDLRHHYIVPGFIDVHVHGVEGRDTLDGGDVIQAIAEALPRYGVTAFSPTTVACTPPALRSVLASVRALRSRPAGSGARVLPAHLESNFINPDYNGAQPVDCLRSCMAEPAGPPPPAWGADAILAEIATARPDVGIITVAPELDGALDLIREFAACGHHVSLGHSGASYDQALAGIRAGARQATHLFNRMTPLGHRAPGLAAAVLESDDVYAEVICDGVHVHPAMLRVAIAAKGPQRIMAITDGTAGSGLATGATATLGGRRITVRDAAYLDDGTLAGSVLTMDRAFARLVTEVGLTISDAATVCATTPARALGLHRLGMLVPGAIADLTVLDHELRVVQTWIGGGLVFSAEGGLVER